jgi:putative ATPase
MRPRTFAEYVGQEHIIGEGRLLRRAVQADQLTSLILWGSPGTGKTTLANVIANESKARFVTLNAVLDGVKELRDVVAEAENTLESARTLLFIDEIHRWSKSQQDGLLPHVERGTVTLIGATTENPFYALVNPLLSRSRVFKLEPLTEAHLYTILDRAIHDSERGFGTLKARVDQAALDHWVGMCGGDARSALNALELAVQTTAPNVNGEIIITVEIAAESIQRRVLRYDRDQDEHYDTVSAFIKSLRGSDPDAALYWMAKMLAAGEDPRFIFRRMMIVCSEDIGLADSRAIVTVTALANAFEQVGLPEGHYFLAHACLYCATAPKSNSTSAIFKSLAQVEQQGTLPVPPHLRDGTSSRLQATHDQRENPTERYLSPHDYPAAWVAQQYLPEEMDAPDWYQPKPIGDEAVIQERLRSRRGL